jgi:hypothetical protein
VEVYYPYLLAEGDYLGEERVVPAGKDVYPVTHCPETAG